MNTDGEPEDQIQKNEIELIASDYEWRCPNCEAFNKEIEITEIVQCDDCHYLYRTGEAHHAHG